MSVTIDDTLFSLVAENELAAIVRKVGEGKSLSARERALIESRRPAPEPSFELLSEPCEPTPHLTQAELAEMWGYSHRQLKNWIADGKAAADPAPLTRPDDMPAWFARVYSPRECPDRLRLAAQQVRLRLTAAPASNPAPPAAMAATVEVAEEEKGLLAMLQRLRSSEARLYAEYEALVLAGDEQKSKFVFSEWGKIAEKLRAAEKGAPRTLEELGLYMRKSEVARELTELHSAVLKSFRQALRHARLELQAAATQRDWNARVDAIIDAAGERLCAANFAAPLELVET